MKNLSNPETKEEIFRRLLAIHPATQRRWGKMSSHQMVCHLGDSYRMFVGEKPVKPAPVPYPRTLLRWIALSGPSPLATRVQGSSGIGPASWWNSADGI